MSSEKSAMYMRKTTFFCVTSILVSLAFISLKTGKVIDLPWIVIFAPLWVATFSIAAVIYDIYMRYKKKGERYSADATAILGWLFVVCLLAILIMIQLDISNMADCRDATHVIDLENDADVSRVCGCDQHILEEFFKYSTCYWNTNNSLRVNSVSSPRDEEAELPCGERKITMEQLYTEFISKTKCELRSEDSATGKHVVIEVGDICEKTIPIFFVILPFLVFLGYVLYRNCKSNGPMFIFPEDDGVNIQDVPDIEMHSDNDDADVSLAVSDFIAIDTPYVKREEDITVRESDGEDGKEEDVDDPEYEKDGQEYHME
jgi:hypothetical protein